LRDLFFNKIKHPKSKNYPSWALILNPLTSESKNPAKLSELAETERSRAHPRIAKCYIGYYLISMTTFSLKLDEKLAASLAAEARMRRTTRSELCRRAIAGLLRQSGKSKPTLFQQTQDLSGAGSSGLGDLSSNPRHLIGFGQKAR
jgi:hypothetical protein